MEGKTTAEMQRDAAIRRAEAAVEARKGRREGESVIDWLIRRNHPDGLSDEERSVVNEMRRAIMYHEVSIGKRFMAECRTCGPLGVVQGTGPLDLMRRGVQAKHLVDKGFISQEELDMLIAREEKGRGKVFQDEKG